MAAMYQQTNGMRKGQAAQGLVEFALVLPILLLLIFGVFAFGHLFFSYTMVVAASREAARFGAATGLTDVNLPRFRDCDSIREAAVRIGSVAGVKATDVSISYDAGPSTTGDPTPYPHDCPIGGIGPGYIGLGDRILVTVSITYTPIAPLVPIPSFPLTATTHRTIIRALPVGDSTPAVPVCTGTITRIIPPTWEKGLEGSFSVVGEDVIFKLETLADNPEETPTGTIKMWVDEDEADDDSDPYNDDPFCTGTAPNVVCPGIVFDDLEEHIIYAEYISSVPTGADCISSGLAEPLIHTMNPADTEIVELTQSVDQTLEAEQFTVNVKVRSVEPGGGAPEGPLVLIVSDGNRYEVPLSEDPDDENASIGSLAIKIDNDGTYTITAVYDPDDLDKKYGSSQDTIEHLVVEKLVLVGTDTDIVSPDDGSTSYKGDSVTVVVEVRPNDPGLSGQIGWVHISDGRGNSCDAQLQADPKDTNLGRVSCTFVMEEVGSRTITATYNHPDYPNVNPGFISSSDQIKLVVVEKPVEPVEYQTVTNIRSPKPGTIIQDDEIIVQVEVTLTGGSGSSEGTVTISDNFGGQCMEPVVPDSSAPGTSQAVCVLSASQSGDYLITAVYDPKDPAYIGSEDTVTVTVNLPAYPYPVPVTDYSTETAILPIGSGSSTVGDSVDVTVEVRANDLAAGTPTGTVAVSDRAGSSCPISLAEISQGVSGGSCSLTLNTEGTITIEAVYTPEAGSKFTGSQDTETHQVNPQTQS